MAGAGKRVIVYILEMVELELMYKLFDRVVGDLDDLVKCLSHDGDIRVQIRVCRTNSCRSQSEGRHSFP